MPEFEESWLQVFYDGMDRKSKELHQDRKSLVSKENFMSELVGVMHVKNDNLFIFDVFLLQSNLCTTTSPDTLNLWPLLAGGRCSEVALC